MRLHSRRAGLSGTLYAMYSSLTDGITTDPVFMTIPIDDHLPQRGDGVFESLKCQNGQLYNTDAHLARLENSCERIDLALPVKKSELINKVCATIRAGGRRNCLIRILVSRGTKNMGIDPVRCEGPELYIVVYCYSARIENGHLKPARAALSSIPIKPTELATIKSCNYLPNVLMKIEANRLAVDFVISIDANGNLGEGATENMGLLTKQNELLMPTPQYVLSGTTAQRTLELAQTLVSAGMLTIAEYRDISPQEAQQAKEIFIIGTTADITPVIEWEGQPVGDGTPGPVTARLFDLLKNDMNQPSFNLQI